MAKVHPILAVPSIGNASASISPLTGPYMTSKRETFTIWMKSLVMQGHGCTAYDENGEIVYRVENYDNKHSDEVYLMDLRGKVLFTICQQKMCVFRSNWEAYESNESDTPFFRVRKTRIFGGCSSYKVTMPSDDGNHYTLEAGGKSTIRISDGSGEVLAEAKRKQSSSGVELGDDVLSLVVEPHVDHSFIMALVTVYGLIKRQI
ncbi:protein LURP-one-related 11-like [Argentina anserina]|uniref:protein LURP-one-related 11-like n=1 Tax=Argentina anserina TaxID=57926 RepID=UPI0021761DB6|nr:protein LURP-one-related 11-like [Potentilla anserina]